MSSKDGAAIELGGEMSTEPVTDLDHARYDRDIWIETAFAAQRRCAELEAENARLLIRGTSAEAQRDWIEYLEAEVARLRKGVEDYRAGNYESPRSHRPRPCPHGLSYWQECDACNDAALAAILTPPDPSNGPGA